MSEEAFFCELCMKEAEPPHQHKTHQLLRTRMFGVLRVMMTKLATVVRATDSLVDAFDSSVVDRRTYYTSKHYRLVTWTMPP
jgi:hypothetical protein